MMTTTWSPPRMAAVTIVLMLGLSACYAADDSAEPAAAGATTTAAAAPATRAADGASGAGSERTDVDTTPAFLHQTVAPEFVIRDARVELRVVNFDEAWSALRDLAETAGGYVGDASTGIEERGEERYAVGTATLKVPSTRFEFALDRIDELGERLSQTITGTDVGEEFVDLEARLRHWKRVEEFTLGLMDQATTVKESLDIQNQLNETQLTIEQIEGRLRYLQSRVSLSTVTVSLTEAPAGISGPPQPAPEPSPIREAFSQAADVILGSIGFAIVGGAFLLPFGMIALAGLVVWRIGRRLVPRRAAPDAQT